MQFRRFVIVVLSCVVLASCAPMKPPVPVAQVKDGELPVPADYKTWPKYLSAVQRPDIKQVREIYMNSAAKAGTAAQGFPNGTVFVMENFAVKVDASGNPVLGPDGKLVKGDLLRVFVMGKNAGWGASAPVAAAAPAAASAAAAPAKKS